MRKITSFLGLLFMCMIIMSVPVMAASEEPELGFDFEAYEAQEKIDGTPKLSRWSYTESTAQSLSVENKEATAYARVSGYDDKATKVVIYMYIQQLKDGSWKTIDSHRYEKDSWHLSKEITYSPCPHGYTYRLKTSYYVYSGTEYEYISAKSANFVYK